MTLKSKYICLFLLFHIFSSAWNIRGLTGQQSPTLLSGFTDDEIFGIEDDQPLTATDRNLARLLYRIHNSSQKSILQSAKDNLGVTLKQIVADPRSHRCYVFQVSGFAQSILKQINTDADPNDIYAKYDLICCKTNDDLDFLVAVPESGRPSRWPENVSIHEPINIAGFFLANFDFHPENTPKGHIGIEGLASTKAPLFVTNQINWFPDRSSGKFRVTESELALSKFGVNIAKLDHVRRNILGKIDRRSTDSFYQFLGAVDKIPVDQFPAKTFDFKECIQQPKKLQGAAMKLRGQIRRVTEVQIPESRPEYPQIEKYFQLDLFVPLGDHKIVFRTPNSPSEHKPQVHENRFPVTVCVPKLPLPKQEMNRKNVTIPCFFFQRWSYLSEGSSDRAELPFQDAPLAIGLVPELTVAPESPLNLWIGIFGLICLLGIGVLYLAFGRPGSPGQTTNRRQELPRQLDVSNLKD